MWTFYQGKYHNLSIKKRVFCLCLYAIGIQHTVVPYPVIMALLCLIMNIFAPIS